MQKILFIFDLKCVKIYINYIAGSFVMKNCVVYSACSNTNLFVAGYGYALTCCNNADYCNAASGYFKLNKFYIFIGFYLVLKLN